MSTNSSLSVYIDANKVTIPNGWVQVSSYASNAGSYYAFWNNQKSYINTSSLAPADANKIVAQVTYNVIRMYHGANDTFNYNGPVQYAPWT